MSNSSLPPGGLPMPKVVAIMDVLDAKGNEFGLVRGVVSMQSHYQLCLSVLLAVTISLLTFPALGAGNLFVNPDGGLRGL